MRERGEIEGEKAVAGRINARCGPNPVCHAKVFNRNQPLVRAELGQEAPGHRSVRRAHTHGNIDQKLSSSYSCTKNTLHVRWMDRINTGSIRNHLALSGRCTTTTTMYAVEKDKNEKDCRRLKIPTKMNPTDRLNTTFLRIFVPRAKSINAAHGQID